jgi:hypothetical protein
MRQLFAVAVVALMVAASALARAQEPKAAPVASDVAALRSATEIALARHAHIPGASKLETFLPVTTTAGDVMLGPAPTPLTLQNAKLVNLDVETVLERFWSARGDSQKTRAKALADAALTVCWCAGEVKEVRAAERKNERKNERGDFAVKLRVSSRLRRLNGEVLMIYCDAPQPLVNATIKVPVVLVVPAGGGNKFITSGPVETDFERCNFSFTTRGAFGLDMIHLSEPIR